MASLVDVLRRKLRMLKEDALAVSHVVEQAFSGHDEVDDEAIDKDLRQVFYDLQDEKILDVRRAEYVRDGQRLRGYYWHIRPEAELDMVQRPQAEPDPVEHLYLHLRQSAWERRRGPE